MSSIAFCLVAFLFQVVPSFLVMLSCHLLHGRPLDLFRLLGCHSVQRLVHLLSFILAMCPAYLHFCFSVYSIMLIIFVLFLISEHGILSVALYPTFSSPLLFELFSVCQLFIERPCLAAIGHCWCTDVVVMHNESDWLPQTFLLAEILWRNGRGGMVVVGGGGGWVCRGGGHYMSL